MRDSRMHIINTCTFPINNEGKQWVLSYGSAPAVGTSYNDYILTVDEAHANVTGPLLHVLVFLFLFLFFGSIYFVILYRFV